MTYKTSLKNRENALKHKNEIKDLVNREINKQINTKDLDMSGGETNYSRPGADVDYETSLRSMNDNVPAALRQEETDELNDEMLTTRRNYQRIETIKKRNKFRKFNAFATSARPGLQIFSAGLDPHASMTPRVNLIICQICSK